MKKNLLKFIGTVLSLILGFSSTVAAQETTTETETVVAGGVYRSWEIKAGMKIALRGCSNSNGDQWFQVPNPITTTTEADYKTNTFNPATCVFEIEQATNDPTKIVLRNGDQYIAKAQSAQNNPISFTTTKNEAAEFSVSCPTITDAARNFPADDQAAGFVFAENMRVRFITTYNGNNTYLNTNDTNKKPKFHDGTAGLSAWLVYSVGTDYSKCSKIKDAAPITDLSTLTNGTKVMFKDVAPDDNNTRQGWIFEGDDNRIYTTQYEPTNSLNSSRYIWTVNVVNGKYTFTNLETGRWMRFDNNTNTGRDNNTNIQTKNDSPVGEFTIGNGSREGVWHILSNTQYFNGEPVNGTTADPKPEGTTGFTTWSTAHDYEIYPVATQNETTCEVTLQYVFKNGYTLQPEETVTIRNGGSYSFNAPAITNNTIQYYMVGDQRVETSEASTSPITSDITIKYVYDFTNFPFESSNIDGSFSTDTKWYLLTLSGTYLHYVEGKANIPLATTKNYDNTYWWAFHVKDNGAIEIYNKAAGPDKVLSSAAPSSSDQLKYPQMIAKNSIPEGNNSAWDITSSDEYFTANNGFFLDREGNADQSETYKLNSRSDSGSPLVAYWNQEGKGSTLYVLSLEDEITALQDLEKTNVPDAIGALKTDKFTEFTKALAQGTPEGLKTAKEISENQSNHYQFDTNLYYRLENGVRDYNYNGNYNSNNPTEHSGYLEVVDHLERTDYRAEYNFYSNIRNNNRAAAIWQFQPTETENVYNLYNLNAKLYIKGADGEYLTSGTTTLTDADALTLASLGNAQFNIKKNGTNQRLHISGVGDIAGAAMYYTGGDLNSASAWYIIPATSIDINISDVGYATVNYPFAVQLPSDGTISAYIGTKIQGKTTSLLLKKISDGLIPANTPVVLVGNAGNHTLSIVADEVSTSYEVSNILSGTLQSKEIPTGTTIYGLSNPSGGYGVGFYKLDESEDANRIVPANKAYLPKSELTEAVQGVRGFTFSFDDESGETTSIENVTVNLEEEEFYDLQGRRVMNPTKGIYVTKSGKKILFTK